MTIIFYKDSDIFWGVGLSRHPASCITRMSRMVARCYTMMTLLKYVKTGNRSRLNKDINDNILMLDAKC